MTASLRAPDRCPYSQPFPVDFADCAAYLPTRFVPLDLSNEPLGPVWMCSHLVIERDADRHFYPCCTLGDEASRDAWVSALPVERLLRLRLVGFRIGEELTPQLSALWAAKGKQLAHRGLDPKAREGVRDSLAAAAEGYVSALVASLEAHRNELEELGLPVEASIAIAKVAIDDLVSRGRYETAWVPEEPAMADFEPEGREFLLGLLRASTGAPAPARLKG